MRGCSVFESQQPWAGLEKADNKRLIVEGNPAPEAPEILWQRGDRLVKRYENCLSTDSTERPSMEYVLDQFSPAFATSDWMAQGWACALLAKRTTNAEPRCARVFQNHASPSDFQLTIMRGTSGCSGEAV